jgi:NifU-like protein involved in Fe-S cluster formation
MYSQALWRHIRNPENRGPLPNATHRGESRYPKCGDHFELQLRIENGRIEQAKFQARACGPVVAVGSAGTESLLGLTPEQALQLSAFTLDELVGGLPTPKRHAILLFLDSLHQALLSEKGTPI